VAIGLGKCARCNGDGDPPLELAGCEAVAAVRLLCRLGWHRWHYEFPMSRVCRWCHQHQRLINDEWRWLGIIVGWRMPVQGTSGECITHSKTGGEYVVLLSVKHTETGEALTAYAKRTWQARAVAWLVASVLRGEVWARPTSMFNEDVRVPIMPNYENGPEKWAKRFVRAGR
jgi:hypothetical protein